MNIKKLLGSALLALMPLYGPQTAAQAIEQDAAIIEATTRTTTIAPPRGSTTPQPDPTGQPVKRRVPPDQYPLLNLNPARYRLVASNNPNDHLGNPRNQALDTVALEHGSDWRNDNGFTNTVQGIMQGPGVKDDEDALLKFGDWLGKSRPYGSQKYLPAPTVLTMFYDENGVCYQASTILASAARMNGIPATSFNTWDHTHQMTRVHAPNSKGDLEWMIFNVNFGWNFAMVTNEENNDWKQLAGYEYRAVEQHTNIPRPSQNTTLRELRIIKTNIIEDTENAKRNGVEYGTVDFQNNPAKLYIDSDKNLHDTDAPGRTAIQIRYRIQAEDDTCMRDLGIAYTSTMRNITPGIGWRAVTNDGGTVEQQNWAAGNFETILPYTTKLPAHPQCDAYYIVRYATSNDINATDANWQPWLTYQKFSLRDGPVSLDPANEQCATGVRQDHCDYVKEQLLKIPPKHMLPYARY